MAGTAQGQERSPTRTRLTPSRVIEAAVALADEVGVDALTIRKLAVRLDVKPMTIYHHVANKEAIIDGMVEYVFGEIALPPPELDWKPAMRVRAESARDVLRRHPWATPLLDSRTSPGPATLRHHDAVLGCLRSHGFSIGAAAAAIALLDAFIYGFAIQEASLPATRGEEIRDLVESIGRVLPPGEYPYLEDMTEYALAPGYDFGDEFAKGLDVILDGIEPLR